MTALHRLVLVAAFALPFAAHAETARPARAAASGGEHIYQQRLADGRVVLTDRPIGGAQTQRTWQIAREDPEAAFRRSEQVRLEAAVVAERVQRRIDHEQLRDIEADRMRANLAEARLEAEAARDDSGDTGVLFAPVPFSRFGRNHRARPGMQSGAGYGFRPGTPGFHTSPRHSHPWRPTGGS